MALFMVYPINNLIFMKKLVFTAVILFGCLLFKTADAQLTISAGVNIGNQPSWGPVGYNNARYYYIPDIDAYYDVPAHVYVYRENNVWVHRGYLPPRFRNWDRYHSYKVVINDRNPWERHEQWRSRYAGYRGRRDQVIIRQSRDERYRNHWRGDEDRRDRGGYGDGDRGDRGHGDHGARDQGDRH